MTQRLIIRKLEHEDLPERVKWFNHPSLYMQMPLQVPISLSDTKAWHGRNALNANRVDFCFFLDEGKEEERAAMGGLVNFDHKNKHCELYIAVKPGLYGKGIGSMAVQWMLNFAFQEQGFERVFLYTNEDNEGARRLYEKLGFKQEGVLRKHAFLRGTFVDRYVHGIMREEWSQQHWATNEPVSFSYERAAT